MPAYNFQARFAPLVASGAKKQTIRAIGKKRHARPGERVQLYLGQRTKNCRKLVDPDPVCASVNECVIDVSESRAGLMPEIYVAGRRVEDKEAFARADGFENFDEMFRWFFDTHGIPFRGVFITWEETR